MNKAIMYVGNFLFPDGNASGKRVYGNSCIFRDLGYKVFCYGFSKEGRINKREENGICYRSVPYINGIRRLECNKPFKDILGYYKEICAKGYMVEAIIMYGSVASTSLNLKIIKWGHRNHINMYYDHVDIFTTPQKMPVFRYVMKLYENWVLENKVFPKCDGIIAISSYIDKKHRNHCKTVIIPPVVENIKRRPELKENNFNNNKVNFVYAGTISDKNRKISEWKDRIDLIISAFYDLYISGNQNAYLKMLGFTADEFIGMLPRRHKAEYKRKIKSLQNRITFWGLCNSDITIKEIQKSDFSILLRDKKVSTEAGFPTKISESVMCGVPVIVNATSDISYYIKDGYNGYIVEKEKIRDKLIKICEMDRDEIMLMKANCYKTKEFIYTEYLERMKQFLDGERHDI